MHEDDKSYYQRRIEQELDAAEQAAEDQVAAVHRALAARYAQLARGSASQAFDVVSDVRPAEAHPGRETGNLGVLSGGSGVENPLPSPASSSQRS